VTLGKPLHYSPPNESASPPRPSPGAAGLFFCPWRHRLRARFAAQSPGAAAILEILRFLFAADSCSAEAKIVAVAVLATARLDLR